MKRALVFSLVGLGLAGLAVIAGPYLFGKSVLPRPIPGGTLRVSPFGNQLNLELDPARESHVFLMQQLYDGLVKLDKTLSPTPALAEYWVISDSGRKYTFYLRQGVRFHDGRELTADDVAFSLTRLVSPEINSPYARNLLGKVVGAQDYWDGKAPVVSGFRVLGKYVFEIEWVNPYVSALYLLGMSYSKILPRSPVLAQGKDFFRKPVGTGPFKFAYWMRDPRLEIIGIRLERNAAYFDRAALLDAVEFSPFFTFDDFMHGDVDIYPFVSERFARVDCQVVNDGALDLVFLGMSCHLEPLNRPAVRQALSLGLDRRLLTKASFTSESVPEYTGTFIPAKLKGFFPAAGDLDYSPERARSILAANGFTADREFPTLAFYTSRANPALGNNAYRELQSEFEPLGISLAHREYKSLREVRSAREPYLVMVEWRLNFPDPMDILWPLFYSRSDTNVMGYTEKRVDEALEAAEVESSFSKRIDLFNRIENQLQRDLPAVPLFTNQRRMALQAYVKGVEVSPLGFFYLDLRNVWLDKER
jgi:ABC-type transport system substrate-binding protein